MKRPLWQLSQMKEVEMLNHPYSELFEQFKALGAKLDNIQELLKATPQSNIKSEADQRFTVKQLAEYWQCHEQTIMQKKRKGELPFIQHGRKVLFSKNAIDKLTSNPVSKSGR
jgi:excisionase family DNA binding protein